MRTIAQVRARRAARGMARDAALVGALLTLTASLWVFTVLVIGNRGQRVTPLAAHEPVAAGPLAGEPPAPSVPDQAVQVPVEIPVPALAEDTGTFGGAGGAGGAASGLASSGIPQTALQAYQQAELSLSIQRPSCHLDWPLVAALARVESNHGRFGGAVLTVSGVSVPAIRGPRLDGTRFALIRDSDGGRLDGDPVFDRAVGPLQFLPQTWHAVGADGTGDGVADPDNIFDAALTAGVYLCSGHTDLADPAGVRGAVFRYNHSSSYVDMVLALAADYRRGATITGAGTAGAAQVALTGTAPAGQAANPGAPAASTAGSGGAAGGASTASVPSVSTSTAATTTDTTVPPILPPTVEPPTTTAAPTTEPDPGSPPSTTPCLIVLGIPLCP